MRSARKLTLKKESLGELSTAELESVAGANTTTTTISRIIDPCITVTDRCPTRPAPICERISQVIDPCIPG